MNDTEKRESYGFFSAERARKILRSHKSEEVIVTFLKRTNGEWREMTCRITDLDRGHDLADVLEIQHDAQEQGDMFGDPGPPTRPRTVPLDSISRIETEWLVYTPTG